MADEDFLSPGHIISWRKQPTMTFAEAQAYLLGLGHETLAIKLGLANTERLLEALGNPQKSGIPIVQIAGTNGKGSTAVMLDAIARAAGSLTALYTSPHLISMTERMRFDGREIDQAWFAYLTEGVKQTALRLCETGIIPTLPTFFEHLTVMFLCSLGFATDLVILETGLGGRLDATTAAGAEVVGITPIALDHQEYLGETLVEIAAEKAAIIRPGVRAAVIAPQSPEVLAVIEQRCAEVGLTPRLNDCPAEIHGAEDDGRLRVTFQTPRDRYENVLLGLRGRHQVTNACVAIQLAEEIYPDSTAISREAVSAGLEAARHAGRLEIWERSPRILFDGAHNIAGARALRDYLDEFITVPFTLVFGAMRDKDLHEIAAILFPAARRLILTQPMNPRAATPEMLADVVPSDFSGTIALAPALTEALSIARAQTPPSELICVTGSLYLVGEAQKIVSAQAR